MSLIDPEITNIIHDAELMSPDPVPAREVKAEHVASLIRDFRDIDNFVWFDDVRRTNVYLGAKAIGEYIHDANITDTVYIDRAGRPIRYAVSEFWRHAYPHERQPRRHFINPELLHPIGGTLPTRMLANYYRKRIISQLIKHEGLPRHLSKDASALIIDGCVHSGKTIIAARNLLDKLGVTDIRVGTFDDERTRPTKHTTSISFKTRAGDDHGCMPYGIDVNIRNDLFNLRTTALQSPVVRETAQLLRQEIRQLIQDGFENDSDYQG